MPGVAPGTVGVAGANGFGVNGAALAPKAPAGVVGTCWEKAAAGVRGICLGSGGVRGIISALGTETLPLTSFSQSLSCHCFLVFHEEYSDLSSHLACFELDVSSHPSHSLFTRFLPCQSLLSFCHHLLPPCHLYQSSFSLPLLSCQSSQPIAYIAPGSGIVRSNVVHNPNSPELLLHFRVAYDLRLIPCLTSDSPTRVSQDVAM